jgi:hypothetical protein
MIDQERHGRVKLQNLPQVFIVLFGNSHCLFRFLGFREVVRARAQEPLPRVPAGLSEVEPGLRRYLLAAH